MPLIPATGLTGIKILIAHVLAGFFGIGNAFVAIFSGRNAFLVLTAGTGTSAGAGAIRALQLDFNGFGFAFVALFAVGGLGRIHAVFVVFAT